MNDTLYNFFLKLTFFTQSSFRKLFKLVHVSIIYSPFFDSTYITFFCMKVWPTLHPFWSFLRHTLSLVHTVCCQMKESKHQLPLKMQSSPFAAQEMAEAGQRNFICFLPHLKPVARFSWLSNLYGRGFVTRALVSVRGKLLLLVLCM